MTYIRNKLSRCRPDITIYVIFSWKRPSTVLWLTWKPFNPLKYAKLVGIELQITDAAS